jgi:GT2 family glycosyltransferase
MEIFVVDNDSKDDSVTMVRTHFPQVKLITSKQNMGFAAANNQAYKQFSGSYIILLNPDACVKPGAIDRAVAALTAPCSCKMSDGTSSRSIFD